jgi:hypothetical protein
MIESHFQLHPEWTRNRMERTVNAASLEAQPAVYFAEHGLGDHPVASATRLKFVLVT